MLQRIEDIDDDETPQRIAEAFLVLQQGEMSIPVSGNGVEATLVVSGPQSNCDVYLIDNNENTIGRCGSITANGTIYEDPREIGTSEFHCPQELDRRYRGMGLMSLMRSVRDEVSGMLDFETSERSDNLIFHIKRGYYPIGYFPNGAADRWNSETDMIDMHDAMLEDLTEFLWDNFQNRGRAERFDYTIRLGYSPDEAQELYNRISADDFYRHEFDVDFDQDDIDIDMFV